MDEASPDRNGMQPRLEELEARLGHVTSLVTHYRDALRVAGLGTWWWDPSSGESWCSEEMYDYLGLAPDGGSPGLEAYLERVHPAQREQVAAAARGVEAGPVEFTHRVVLEDGSERLLLGRAEVVRGADGGPGRMIGIARDITEGQLLRRELAEQHARIRLFLTQAPVVFWATDQTLRVTMARGGGLRAAGMAEDEGAGLHVSEWLGADAGAYLSAHHSALRGESSTFDAEWRERAYEVRVEPDLDETGRVVGTLALALDVTERTRALRAIEERERHFRTIIENVQDIITVMDATGGIRFESAAVEKVLGYGRSERVGRNAFEYIHPDDVAQVQEAFASALRDPGTRHSVAMRLRHASGAWRDLEVVGTNLLDDPAVNGVVVISRDVTERNTLEAQLRIAQRLESVGKLAGGIAHDFNNLLTVIQGNAQMMLAELDPGNPLRADAEEIERASHRAAELTQQLLVFSRRQLMKPELLDPNDVVRETERMLRRFVGEDVRLLMSLGEECGRVRADPGQLQQVLLNLAINARDAMPAGGTLTLTSACAAFPPGAARAGAAVLLSVTDTGVGMTPEVRERAFEPFFTTRGQGEGTGLGLSTAYAIVRESGGFLELHSQPGAGTRADVYLPVADAPAPAAAPAPAQPRPGVILLVEDEDAVRAIARKALERAGYRVVAVASGPEALQVAAERGDEVDMVVSDVVMPRMSGPEMVERLRRDRPDLRVLYITGYTEEAVVRRGLAEGTAELLQKPFSPMELVKRVAELLA